MRAVFGIPGADGGHIAVRDTVVPVAAAGQVLVRARAAAINRGEIKLLHDLRSGNPLPIGVEFAGEVAQVGAGVAGWREEIGRAHV